MEPRRTLPQWLALGAVAGPVLFTCAWVVLGFVSPGFTLFGNTIAPYSAISQPISGLGLGVTAPFMNGAFVLNGLLMVVGGVGIFRSIEGARAVERWTCIALFALAGLGSVLCGVFTLEAFMLHFVGFLLAIVTPMLSFLVAARLLRRHPRWRRVGRWLPWGSLAALALMVLYFTTFDRVAAGRGLGIAGLTQRVWVLEVQVWFVALGWTAFRQPSEPSTGGAR